MKSRPVAKFALADRWNITFFIKVSIHDVKNSSELFMERLWTRLLKLQNSSKV